MVATANERLQRAAVATGNGHTMNVQGLATITFDVVIADTATITFEGAGNTENWVALPATNVSSGASATTATATGIYRVVVLGLAKVRARISSWTGGAVTVDAFGAESAVTPFTASGVTADTELPAAAALADNTATPTAPAVGAFLMVYDGTTWDMWRGTAADGTWVQGSIAHDSPDTGGPVKMGGKGVSALPTAVTANDRVNAYFDLNGRQHVKAGGISTIITANFTRPADTTAYADGDSVSDSTSAPTVRTFTSAARESGGSGIIVCATLIKSTNGSTGDSFDLILTDTTFTATNDNAAFALTDGEANTLIGKISFSSATALGANNRMYHAGGLNIPFLTVGSANLFGALIARGAYSPGNAETFYIRLGIIQD